MPFPFEVAFEQVRANLDGFVDEVFGALQSEFLTLPRGRGFVEYDVFEHGYELLKRATRGFRDVSAEPILDAIQQAPVIFIVLRAILGFTPPEWAYVTTQRSGVVIPQGAARTLDRNIRLQPLAPLRWNRGRGRERLSAMVETACQLLIEGSTDAPGLIHRLDKADTKHGLPSLQVLADRGVPYAMLLYERFLGRPFAGHRDSVSELVGDAVEAAVEAVLSDAGISFRKTKRAERIAGFDRAPDFIIPNEFNPQIVIEAKLTEDDGTARDKVTRVQHLGELAMQGRRPDEAPKFEVIACIAGRGFKVRREDMKKLLLATQGKVFTLQDTLCLVDYTRLAEFRTR
jgi:hypothetical protein